MDEETTGCTPGVDQAERASMFCRDRMIPEETDCWAMYRGSAGARLSLDNSKARAA